MPKFRHIPILALVSVLALESTAQAGQLTNLQLYDGTSGSPTVTIWYTNADGSGSNSAYVYADPQVSSGTTAPLFYCVDLWHDNYLGQTYTINPVASIAFPNSTYADADNRIGWLLTQDQSTPDARAAVQLAMWYTADNVHNGVLNGFSISTGDCTITHDYNQLTSFVGYNPKVSYSADFWLAVHDPSNTLYQNLVSAPTWRVHIDAIPEPGSLVLAGISAVGLIAAGGVRWLRRSA
jgi:hypothetical protein